MADTAQDAALGYIDAVKWIVGISGAVMAGVFLHPEEGAKLPEEAKACLAAVVLLFGISSFGGVVYLLWLNNVRRKKELIAELAAKVAAPVLIPDPVESARLAKEQRDRETKLKQSQTSLNLWYWIFTWSFYLAAILGVFFFMLRIVRTKDPVAAVPLHFTVVQSAVHKTDHGMQAHTFLLNQQTGELWQMVCDQKGEVVAFRRVKRLEAEDAVTPVTTK
ncbi:MAG: hypothetical protein JSS95_07345 [Acidobacteria bacterium]|nr:hypothetical protein [Acidobacteriota bacterium]